MSATITTMTIDEQIADLNNVVTTLARELIVLQAKRESQRKIHVMVPLANADKKIRAKGQRTEQILTRLSRGDAPRAIAKELGIHVQYVYTVKNKHSR